ncbi:GGDEF domain-containing protein, partial [bacterium]|nr:GGDEF domain-containing protein [bacterium]
MNIQSPARLVRRLLEFLTLLLPVAPVAYLYIFQNPELTFHSHAFHEVAIALALLEGVFISYVSWRCYAYSGEVFVKWLTVGFIGFTVVYSLHGLFTPVAKHNMWLFLLYGPASRLLMSVCLVIALIKAGS